MTLTKVETILHFPDLGILDTEAHSSEEQQRRKLNQPR